MHTVELEDDVFYFILGRARPQENPCQTLRRELRIPGKGNGGSSGSVPVAPPALPSEEEEKLLRAIFGEEAVPQSPSKVQETEISSFLKSPDFLVKSTVTDKFLAMLRWAYHRAPQKFETVTQLGGRRRRYFAKSEGELLGHGRSVKPQRISETPFWVVTNNDTPKKRKMLAAALRLAGCDSDTIREAVGALR